MIQEERNIEHINFPMIDCVSKNMPPNKSFGINYLKIDKFKRMFVKLNSKMVQLAINEFKYKGVQEDNLSINIRKFMFWFETSSQTGIEEIGIKTEFKKFVSFNS